MASIEERLSREDWQPMPGEQIIGIITGLEVRQSKKGTHYPVLTIKDENGEHVIPCALMAGDVISARPVPGDRCGVKFHGPQAKSDGSGDTWDKYSIVFEKDDPAPVDWDAMAAERGITAKPTTVAESTAAPWTAEAPADAPF